MNELEEFRARILKIVTRADFRGRFYARNRTYWDELIAYVNLYLPVFYGLFTEMNKEKMQEIQGLKQKVSDLLTNIETLEKENDHLKRTMSPALLRTLQRDKIIKRLYLRGWPVGRIAEEVGMTREGLRKAICRLGLIRTHESILIRKCHFWDDRGTSLANPELSGKGIRSEKDSIR